MIDIYELLKRENPETIIHQQLMNIIEKVMKEKAKSSYRKIQKP